MLTDAFEEMRSRTRITTLQRATVSRRQQRIRKKMATMMGVLGSFLAGSYMRHTMLAPLSRADIDIYVVLSTSEYMQRTPRGLLDHTRNVLRHLYPSTGDISRNGQAVTIKFSDFKVDVVPTFARSDGGYRIPDARTNDWLETNPRQHIYYWRGENRRLNNCLVPLLRMIKAWNRMHGSLLYSFHLETMVCELLRGIHYENYPTTLCKLFGALRKRVAQPTWDPAGYGDNLGRYLATPRKLDASVATLCAAYDMALSAHELYAQGNIEKSYSVWQTIFGEYFPIYG